MQVAKQPIGTKGARITAVISLPGRHLVFIPSSQHVGVSRRIEDEAERARLKEIVEAERPPEGGFIIRTACEGLSKREIQGDIRFLLKLWKRIIAQERPDGRRRRCSTTTWTWSCAPCATCSPPTRSGWSSTTRATSSASSISSTR